MAETRIQFVKFLMVGLASTATTFVVLVGMVEILGADPVQSSIMGYVVAAVINYLLNYHVTFISTARHSVAVPRFLTVVAGGLLVNTAAMYLLVRIFSVSYVLGQLIAVGFVMVVSFILYKWWAFSD